MTSHAAIDVTGLSYRYGSRQALNDLTLAIQTGEIFALLGPNGGGKSTLFRILSTLIPPQQGEVRMLGHDLRRQAPQIRREIGVVFQAPSLDKILTVGENIRHQAALYGLPGRVWRPRRDELLQQLRLTDRLHERVETLSGGLRRRVELAKGMIHRPRLLLMDEPSTGLDPGARSDLWDYLYRLRDRHQVTILLTTHLLEEADKADRLAILNAGSIVAVGTPDGLRATVGGDSITIQTDEPESLAGDIAERFGHQAAVVDGNVRLELPAGHEWITRLVEAFPGRIGAITLGKPTLEDVFIDKTGHRFRRGDREVPVG